MPIPTPTCDPHTMKCLEVWGGNQAVDNGVVMAGLDAWLFSRPFGDQSAGGDIHYVSSCAAGQVTRVLVADVSGHGEAVAGAAHTLRTLMRRYVNFTDQSRFVKELNTEFGAVAEAGGFATAVVATYSAAGDELSVCNAGHPRPLLYSTKSHSWKLMEQAADRPGLANVPLGIAEPTRYDQSRLKLFTGDLVVMYTDSLIEASSADGRMLGQEGLLNIARGLDPSDPAEFLRALLAAVFPAGAASGSDKDDVTVLILRPNGLKPRVSTAVKMKAMSKLATAALTCWLPGGPEFPWPEPGPKEMLRGLRNRLLHKDAKPTK